MAVMRLAMSICRDIMAGVLQEGRGAPAAVRGRIRPAVRYVTREAPVLVAHETPVLVAYKMKAIPGDFGTRESFAGLRDIHEGFRICSLTNW